MAYHIFTKESEIDSIITNLKGTKLRDDNDACFWGFERYFCEEMMNGSVPAVGLLLISKVDDLIKDFNKTFTNIKVKVLFKKKFTAYTNAHVISMNYFIEHSGELEKETNLYFLTLKFNEKYTNAGKYHLFVPIIQFFRTFSPMSAYPYAFPLIAQKVDPTVEDVLKGHNTYGYAGSYGAWCMRKVPLDTFMKMDNI